MIFLAGEHYLNTSFKIASIRYLSLVSNGSITDPSRIICQERVGLEVVNISSVYIYDISVFSCGNEHFTRTTIGVCFPAFSIIDIEALKMVSVSIQDSYGNGLYASNSSIILQNSSFTMNGKNKSCMLLGAAIIATQSSNITMEGKLSFISNSAVFAGAIAADSSTISIDGDVMFQNNSASDSGGAIAANSSTIGIKGDVMFQNNSASVYGGAIVAISSTISINGDVMFQNNSASFHGGAIAANSSTISIKGDVMFQNNSASVYGGAIVTISSTISIKGDVIFQNNSASIFGGAIAVFQVSFIIMDGSISFHCNSAQLGGAMALSGTSCGHLESAFLMFHNNQAVQGGAVVVIASTFYLGGYSEFIGNHADLRGGAISAKVSNVRLQGKVHFRDNNAQLGGSMYLEYNSHIYFSSTTELVLQHNTAEKGGAIYIRDSTYIASCIHTEDDSSQVAFIDRSSCAFGSFSSLFSLIIYSSMVEKGNEVFGGFPSHCNRTTYYKELLQLLQDNHIEASSEPSTLMLCSSHRPPPSNEISVSRGETFRIPVMALDQFDLPVPATVRAYFNSSNGSTSDLAEGQNLQKIWANCTLLNYTVFSAPETVDLYIYAEEGPCGPDDSMRITIHLQECLHVFERSTSNTHCVYMCKKTAEVHQQLQY